MRQKNRSAIHERTEPNASTCTQDRPKEDHILVYTDASDDDSFSGLGIVIIDTKTQQRFIAENPVPPAFLTELRRERGTIINHLDGHDHQSP